MTNNMSVGTPDVVKTNRVWNPIYNTLEMRLRSKERLLQIYTQIHINTHTNCILWNKPA